MLHGPTQIFHFLLRQRVKILMIFNRFLPPFISLGTIARFNMELYEIFYSAYQQQQQQKASDKYSTHNKHVDEYYCFIMSKQKSI